MSRTTLALISTCLLVGSSIFWLALPARAAATILLEPSSGLPGTSVTVEGEGFGPFESVALCWGECFNLGRKRTTGSGEFSRTFSVPTNVPGVYTVSACGQTSGCAQTEFIVIAPATTIVTTTTAPETTTTIADAPTTTRATTTTTARTTTTRQMPPIIGATTTIPSFGPLPTTPSFGTPTPTQPDQSDPVLADATTTPQPEVTTTLVPPFPGSEVLTLFLTPSEPTEGRDAAAPLTPEGGEAAPLAAAAVEGDQDGRGLDQTEAILLWVATMSLAAGGLIAYEYRRR